MQLTAYKSRPGCEHVWEDAHLTLRAGDGNPVLQTKVRHCRKCEVLRELGPAAEVRG